MRRHQQQHQQQQKQQQDWKFRDEKKKKKKYELYNNGELSSKSKVKRKKNDLEKKILFPTPEKKFHRNISRNNVQNEKGGRQNT